MIFYFVVINIDNVFFVKIKIGIIFCVRFKIIVDLVYLFINIGFGIIIKLVCII